MNTAPCGDRESSSGQRRTGTRQEQLPSPVMRKKSQQHSKRCRTRFDILCATAIGEGASKPRRGSELHQTLKCHEMPNQLQPSSAACVKVKRHNGEVSKRHQTLHTTWVNEERATAVNLDRKPHSVWMTKTPREVRRQEQGATRSPASFQSDADGLSQAQWNASFPRAESAPVVMQLSDTRRSRDECLRGRTQLWACARRKLMPQENPCVARGHMT